MVGRYQLTIRNRRIEYEVTIDRSVTVIKGNSGTGKTTLIRMIQGYEAQGNRSGIMCRCTPDVKLHVLLPGMNWERELDERKGQILFIDESVDYLYSESFQKAFIRADSYLVIISRSGRFNQLPYAVNSIYELRTEKSKDISLTKMYRLYEYKPDDKTPQRVVTEDSNAGMEMMEQIFPDRVVSANGNANVAKLIGDDDEEKGLLFAVVDGAAFGGYIERTMNAAIIRGNTIIFAPESFEYLVLQLDAYRRHLSDEISATWKYCNSGAHLTWERYYTALLDSISYDNYGFHYSKKRLNKSFKNDNVKRQIRENLYKYAVRRRQ